LWRQSLKRRIDACVPSAIGYDMLGAAMRHKPGDAHCSKPQSLFRNLEDLFAIRHSKSCLFVSLAKASSIVGHHASEARLTP
jgi:hypothetical protein